MALKSQNYGFTLIEILVVFGILALIGGLTSDLFASVLKGANKANTVNEIKQNGNYALHYIERVVRNSNYVYSDSENLVVSDKVSGECIKFTIKDRTVGVENGEIDFFKVENQSCVIDEDGYNDGETFPDPRVGRTLMNNDAYTGVSLEAGSFGGSNSESVTVIFTLSQGEKANSRNDYTASESFQSFVSLRTY